jgi:protein-tyrosine-phosphatase
MRKIVFICTGNTCRSPIAEKLTQKKLEEYQLDIEVISRGILVNIPSEASTKAIKSMKNYDVDLSIHKSAEFSINDVDDQTVILTMTKHHKDYLCYLYPSIKEQAFVLKEFVGDYGDIRDPYGENQATYDSVAQEIEYSITKLIENKMLHLVNNAI